MRIQKDASGKRLQLANRVEHPYRDVGQWSLYRRRGRASGDQMISSINNLKKQGLGMDRAKVKRQNSQGFLVHRAHLNQSPKRF